MKKLLIAILMSAGLFSCSKDKTTDPDPDPADTTYKCASCKTAPEAKAEYNSSSAGVYKGVLVGSTGTIALYLYNTGTEVKALVAFDGKNTTLSTTALSNWTPGQAITNALFTGQLDGKDIQATFSVEANGQNPKVSVQIPGHNIVVAVYKETSTTLLKNYEGTYTGSRSGTFNLALNGNEYSILSGGAPIVGTLVNGKINLTVDQVEVIGEFSGDDVSGTWKDSKKTPADQGTWKGKRTL